MQPFSIVALVLLGAVLNLEARAERSFDAHAYRGGPCTGVWDASHDVVGCINAAEAAANALGGGTVIVPAGSFGQSTSLLAYEKVRVVGAGCGDGGRAGTQLTAIRGFTGPLATIGSDTATAGYVGVSGICFDGATTAAIGFKLRSVRYGWFQDIYMKRVTTTGWDVDAGATIATPVIFNHFIRTYTDLGDAAAVNANGWNIGSPANSTSADTQRNEWWDNIVLYQNGTGIVCGFMDSNRGYGWHVEPIGGGTGISLDMQGGTANSNAVCQSNIFQGEFGASRVGAATQETNTYVPYGNTIIINQTSGAPDPVVNGGTLAWVNQTGYRHEPKNERNIQVPSFTVGASEIGSRFTNTGAGFATIGKLPPSQVGMQYCFLADGHRWTFVANGSDKVRYAATLGAAGGNVVTATNASGCLEVMTSGIWDVSPYVGIAPTIN